MKKNTRHYWLPPTWILAQKKYSYQDALYLTGRKTGNAAKSSELSAGCWRGQGSLDQRAEQNKQKTVRTGLRTQWNHAPENSRRFGYGQFKNREGGNLKNETSQSNTYETWRHGQAPIDVGQSMLWFVFLGARWHFISSYLMVVLLNVKCQLIGYYALLEQNAEFTLLLEDTRTAQRTAETSSMIIGFIKPMYGSLRQKRRTCATEARVAVRL